jgi:hypothetical protein
VWDVDRLGLTVARLIVTRLLGPGEPITVVIDDTDPAGQMVAGL